MQRLLQNIHVKFALSVLGALIIFAVFKAYWFPDYRIIGISGIGDAFSVSAGEQIRQKTRTVGDALYLSGFSYLEGEHPSFRVDVTAVTSSGKRKEWFTVYKEYDVEEGEFPHPYRLYYRGALNADRPFVGEPFEESMEMLAAFQPHIGEVFSLTRGQREIGGDYLELTDLWGREAPELEGVLLLEADGSGVRILDESAGFAPDFALWEIYDGQESVAKPVAAVRVAA